MPATRRTVVVMTTRDARIFHASTRAAARTSSVARCCSAWGAGAVGLAFAGIASITAQLSRSTRAAVGMAGTVLGAAFVLRGLGDMAAVQGSGSFWLSWFSPLGWSQQTAPFVFNRWWPLLLTLAFACGAALLGYLGLLAGGLAYGSFTQPLIDGSADLVAVRGGSEDVLSG
jgi:ABC-2 type transport system permease protein